MKQLAAACNIAQEASCDFNQRARAQAGHPGSPRVDQLWPDQSGTAWALGWEAAVQPTDSEMASAEVVPALSIRLSSHSYQICVFLNRRAKSRM